MLHDLWSNGSKDRHKGLETILPYTRVNGSRPPDWLGSPLWTCANVSPFIGQPRLPLHVPSSNYNMIKHKQFHYYYSRLLLLLLFMVILVGFVFDSTIQNKLFFLILFDSKIMCSVPSTGFLISKSIYFQSCQHYTPATSGWESSVSGWTRSVCWHNRVYWGATFTEIHQKPSACLSIT